MTRPASTTFKMTTNDKTRMRLRTPNFLRTSTIALGLLCFIAQACLLVNAASANPSDGVSKAIAELRRMRLERKPTIYEDAEQRVAEWLKQLPDPKDQVEIWKELTELYFNGGPAKRTIECAKKTLELPLAPEKRIRFYWIWATAETTADPSRDGAALRKIAVPICLQGVAEFRKLKIPPIAIYSDVPAGSLPPRGAMPRGAMPSDPKQAGAILATLARDCCLGLVTQLYARPPYAPDGELRALVMEKLNDPELADELQRIVEADRKAQLAASRKRVGISGTVGSDAKHGLPPAPSRARQVLLLSSFLLILTVVLVARRWHASP